jgi:hypothetical protein
MGQTEAGLQARLERETSALAAQYGDDFFFKDRERHRADLSLAYGICDPS